MGTGVAAETLGGPVQTPATAAALSVMGVVLRVEAAVGLAVGAYLTRRGPLAWVGS